MSEETPDEGQADADALASAYKRLGLDNAIKGFDAMKIIGAKHVLGALTKQQSWGLDRPGLGTHHVIDPLRLPPSTFEIPEIHVDDSPQRTADATEQMARKLADMHLVTEDLVRLTATNLQHTAEQRELAARTERFTRGMTWASLAVAVASLGAAVVAVFVR